MRCLQFTVPPTHEGVRVRGFLRGYCRVSARLLAQCKRLPGGITVNGQARIATDFLHAGQVLTLRLPQEPAPAPIHPAGAAPLRVLYEDASLLAVDKPAGMIAYARAGNLTGTLRDVALAYLAASGQAQVYHPLYRLDRDTTGVVLLAKDRYAAAAVPGTVHKAYWALCEGLLQGEGTVDAPIGPAAGSKVRQCLRPDGRQARTHWRAVAQGGGHTLLRCVLDTGRTHQIRVHLASIGHPLAGDDFYGGSRARIQRQALHCAELSFLSPDGGAHGLSTPFPADMRALLQALGVAAPAFLLGTPVVK